MPRQTRNQDRRNLASKLNSIAFVIDLAVTCNQQGRQEEFQRAWGMTPDEALANQSRNLAAMAEEAANAIKS